MDRRGILCWVASRDSTPGESRSNAVANAIERCQVLLLVWSSAACDSRNVESETTFASRLNKIILPVRVEDLAFSDSFKVLLARPYVLNAFQLADERCLDELASQVSDLLQQVRRDTYRPPFSSQTSKQPAILLASAAYASLEVILHHDPPLLAPASTFSPAQAMIAGSLGLGLTIALCLLICLDGFWLFEVHKNLKSFRPKHLLYTPSSAAASLFIPIVGLIKPALVLNEIWRVSSISDGPQLNLLLWIWWIVRFNCVFMWLYAWRHFLQTYTNYDALDPAGIWLSVSIVLDLVVTYIVIFSTNRRQEAKERSISSKEARRSAVS
jgi:hypothetical protein